MTTRQHDLIFWALIGVIVAAAMLVFVAQILRGGRMLTRYVPLRSGPWRRKAVAASAPDWKKREAEERRRREEERKTEVKALVFGCEYTAVFLKQWFRLNGCPLCGTGRAIKFDPHHTKTRRSGAAGGLAEDIAPLCPDCHTLGGGSVHNAGAQTAEDRGSGVNLRDLAADLAAEGRRQGYLPVERCPECGVWHSVRFFVDIVDTETGELLVSLCQGCAPEGPP